MKSAFPVNGVQRNTCPRCLFFDGNFDRQLITTVCGFPVHVPFEAKLMTPYSSDDEKWHPEYKEMRMAACPCFRDRYELRDSIRSEILQKE